MVEEKNKKGLGRGLMSLFGDQVDLNTKDGDTPKKNNTNTSYLLVSIGDLKRNRFQPRAYFNEGRIDELAQSIKKKWFNPTHSS